MTNKPPVAPLPAVKKTVSLLSSEPRYFDAPKKTKPKNVAAYALLKQLVGLFSYNTIEDQLAAADQFGKTLVKLIKKSQAEGASECKLSDLAVYRVELLGRGEVPNPNYEKKMAKYQKDLATYNKRETDKKARQAMAAAKKAEARANKEKAMLEELTKKYGEEVFAAGVVAIATKNAGRKYMP